MTQGRHNPTLSSNVLSSRHSSVMGTESTRSAMAHGSESRGVVGGGVEFEEEDIFG